MLTEPTEVSSQYISNLFKFEISKNGYLQKSTFPFRYVLLPSSMITFLFGFFWIF